MSIQAQIFIKFLVVSFLSHTFFSFDYKSDSHFPNGRVLSRNDHVAGIKTVIFYEIKSTTIGE